MPTTFQEAPDHVAALVERRKHQYCRDLVEAGVTVAVLFARNIEGGAIKVGGYAADAKIKINGLSDRVEGKKDATMTIDESWWNDATEGEQLALIDHELMHLVVCRNKVGAVKYDDVNRPKLMIRLHDYQYGGFHEIAERHGIDSHEAQSIMNVSKVWEQSAFPWFIAADVGAA